MLIIVRVVSADFPKLYKYKPPPKEAAVVLLNMLDCNVNENCTAVKKLRIDTPPPELPAVQLMKREPISVTLELIEYWNSTMRPPPNEDEQLVYVVK